MWGRERAPGWRCAFVSWARLCPGLGHVWAATFGERPGGTGGHEEGVRGTPPRQYRFLLDGEHRSPRSPLSRAWPPHPRGRLLGEERDGPGEKGRAWRLLPGHPRLPACDTASPPCPSPHPVDSPLSTAGTQCPEQHQTHSRCSASYATATPVTRPRASRCPRAPPAPFSGPPSGTRILPFLEFPVSKSV